MHYYQHDLALVHDRGYGQHADRCALVRDITTFVPDGAGGWRRGHERHENVLTDTSRIPALLAGSGVRATVGRSFGAAELPPGLRAVTGRKAAADGPLPARGQGR